MHAETRCRSVHALGFTTEQKNCGKSGLGHQASKPPGRGGPWTFGLPATATWRAVGRGPLGRGPAFIKTPFIAPNLEFDDMFNPSSSKYNGTRWQN